MITGSTFAADWLKNHAGKWNDAANWSGGLLPNGTTETKIRWNAVSVCTLDSNDNWGATLGGNRLTVYDGATLKIVPDANLTGPGWFRVGKSGAGYVIQSGGTVTLKEGQDTSNLVIGDGGGPGIYTMTGGTITYATGDGQLMIGDRGGTGTLIVSGTAPVIRMKSFYVGGAATDRGANGTLQYNISAAGVSTIHCTEYIKLDLGGANYTANLVVSGCPTNTSIPIVLIENHGSLAVIGTFNMLNGGPKGSATEGATVLLNGHTPYTLTYKYNVEANEPDSGNDIALIPQKSITILTPATNSGDLLIAAVATDEDTSALISAPAGQGWTLIDRGASGTSSGAVTLAVWCKIAGSSEPGSYTFTWKGSNNTGPAEQAYGWMMRFSGQDATNPINGTPVALNSNNISPTSPAVTTTVNNCIILRLGAFNDGSITVGNPGLSGHTAITMNKSSSTAVSGIVSGGAGYVKQSAAGSSGTSNFLLTATEAARMLTIAIAPVPSTCCEDNITP